MVDNRIKALLAEKKMSAAALSKTMPNMGKVCMSFIVRAIVLVHLSDERSDEKTMVETVKAVAGIDDVWAAEAGKTYKLELTPF